MSFIVEDARPVPVTLKIDPRACRVCFGDEIVSRGGERNRKHPLSWLGVKDWHRSPEPKPRDVYIVKDRSAGRNGPSSWNSVLFLVVSGRDQTHASLIRRKGAESPEGASRCLLKSNFV